jgi:pilus assembly protein Flp/PilA
MILTAFLKHIGNDKTGATAIEYGLIVSLIVIAMIGALQGVAGATIDTWSRIETEVVEATSN